MIYVYFIVLDNFLVFRISGGTSYQDAPLITLKRNKRNIIKFINIDQATGESHFTMGEGEIAGTPTDSEHQEII